MKITIDIPDADIRKALDAATTGAVTRWASSLDLQGFGPKTRRQCRALERESGAWHALDIKRGLRLMLQNPDPNKYAHGQGWAPRHWDADQADCFIQYAAFGKLVYR